MAHISVKGRPLQHTRYSRSRRFPVPALENGAELDILLLMMKNGIAKGSCFCGVVQYEVSWPSKFVVNCHCSECRRANASAFVTWIGTWEDRLKVVSGREALSTFQYPEASREFCRHCGSQLFFRGDRWPGEVHITRATLISDSDKEIQAEVFYSDRADWYHPERKLIRMGGLTGTERLDSTK